MGKVSSRVLCAGLAWLSLCFASASASCADRTAASEDAPATIRFANPGSLSAPSGKGSFRFGAASAATQIEDQNPSTDWYTFTRPIAEGGLGRGTAFVGDASRGFSKALEDVELAKTLHLDSYRFSMEWARIEPKRDEIDETALSHYRALLDALKSRDMRPNVTIHHFSNPIWVDDPRHTACDNGPSDENLCGLGHALGGAMVIEEAREHARLLAERFGDRVDDWATVNEPINYLIAAHGVGQFPPGKTKIFMLLEEFMPVVRDYLALHAAVYKAIKEADTSDADGDGVAANVGATLNVAEWIPSKNNAQSEDPLDVAARDRLVYIYHHLMVDSIRAGAFDADLDGTLEEQQPEWKGTLDWLGVQYYARQGVTGSSTLQIPVVRLLPCFGAFDQGSCVPAIDSSFCVPAMGYEYYAPGLYNVLTDFAARWPDLPLVVSESGIATEVGRRRAEHVVRSLEQIERARARNVDVRGYYHWSLFDNFEWLEGFGPRFGLYQVDYGTYERTPTEGAEVLARIAESRTLTKAVRDQYGGSGAMTFENRPADAFCKAQ